MLIQQLNRNDAPKILIPVTCENAVVAGDVVQWSDTDSAANPLGVAVEDSVADDMRVAGVITKTQATAGGVSLLQIYGYNTNITTDGNVVAADQRLAAGSAVATGYTEAEVITDITTADYSGLANMFAWNVSADVSTVGQGFIQTMGCF